MKTRNVYRVIIACCVVFVITAAFMLISASAASAKDTAFSWEPNEETDLAGYKIYAGPSSREYVNTNDCGLPETSADGRVHCTVENTPTENTFYAATAYDTAGNESDYSNEVSDDSPPAAPGGFAKVTVQTTTVVTVQ